MEPVSHAPLALEAQPGVYVGSQRAGWGRVKLQVSRPAPSRDGGARGLASPLLSSEWDDLLADSSFRACCSYGLQSVWVSAIAGCTHGIVAVESKFGQSPRYLLKRALQRAVAYPNVVSRWAPRAQGIAQIDPDRAAYLALDAAAAPDFDVRSTEGAVAATALGLAKAISIHYPAQRHAPTHAHRRVIAITHNAGWMAPRVAAIQESLVKLEFLEAETQASGFVGATTLSALNRAAVYFGCASLPDVVHSCGLDVSPAWALTHPDIFSAVRRSDLFQSLYLAARRLGLNPDEPRFPEYRVRRWHTGWISSVGYAASVVAHAEEWERKMSMTILGGSLSSKER